MHVLISLFSSETLYAAYIIAKAGPHKRTCCYLFAETSNALFDFQDIGMLFVKFINLKMLQIFFP